MYVYVYIDLYERALWRGEPLFRFISRRRALRWSRRAGAGPHRVCMCASVLAGVQSDERLVPDSALASADADGRAPLGSAEREALLELADGVKAVYRRYHPHANKGTENRSKGTDNRSKGAYDVYLRTDGPNAEGSCSATSARRC